MLIFAHYLLLLAVQLKIVRRSFDNILKTAVPKDSIEIVREIISIAFLKQIFNQCSGASQNRYQGRGGLLAEGKIFRVSRVMSFSFKELISQFSEERWLAFICFRIISTIKVHIKLLFAVAYRPPEID